MLLCHSFTIACVSHQDPKNRGSGTGLSGMQENAIEPPKFMTETQNYAGTTDSLVMYHAIIRIIRTSLGFNPGAVISRVLANCQIITNYTRICNAAESHLAEPMTL